MAFSNWIQKPVANRQPIGSYSVATETIDKVGSPPTPLPTRVNRFENIHLISVADVPTAASFPSQEVIFWFLGTSNAKSRILARWSFSGDIQSGYLLQLTGSNFLAGDSGSLFRVSNDALSSSIASGAIAMNGTWRKFRFRIKGSNPVLASLELLQHAGSAPLVSPQLIFFGSDGVPGPTGAKVGFGAFGLDNAQTDNRFDDIEVKTEGP